MSDKSKLQQKHAIEKDYFRKNILDDLLGSISDDGKTLKSELYIPQKERNFSYFEEVLSELGYIAEVYDEEYNSYHECFCKKIRISIAQ